MIRKSAWLLTAGLSPLQLRRSPRPPFPHDTDKQTAQPTPGATARRRCPGSGAEQQPVDTGDIVITATRRNQALSDVPMAVSAVTAQSLRNTGATDIRQLNQVSPSLLVSRPRRKAAPPWRAFAASAPLATIRVLKARSESSSTESIARARACAYRARTARPNRGPARSTRYVVRPQHVGRPYLDHHREAAISAGSQRSGRLSAITILRRFEASITGPLTDTIAARLDGVYVKRDGFLKDVISGRRINDRDRWMLRGQLLFQPSDNFSFRLIADYSHRNEECCGAPFLPAHDSSRPGGRSRPSTIAAIERGLGGIIRRPAVPAAHLDHAGRGATAAT